MEKLVGNTYLTLKCSRLFNKNTVLKISQEAYIYIYETYIHRITRPEVFCEKVLQSFAKFTKKKPVPGSIFPVNFAKFLKIPIHRTPLVAGSFYRSYETVR